MDYQMGKKKKLKQKKNKPSRNIASEIKDLIEISGRNLTLKQIAKKLQLKKKDDIKRAGLILDELEDGRGQERQDEGVGKEGRSESSLQGVVDHVSGRFAYIRVDDGEDDVYVKARDLGGAVDGDTVRLRILPTRHGEHREGRVSEVVKRNRTRFVGKVEKQKSYAFVVPDFKKMHTDFFVYPEHIYGAKSGDKVIIEVTSWSLDDRKPEAKIVQILGRAGENEAEIHSIMAEFDLPFHFPENVLAASQAIPDGITKEEIEKRRDFRSITTFTIDPEDAKDFDDAISFRKLENNSYEIGIHIADVTHYVEPQSMLDQEAFNRATSVYLVDRTIPMLPERLSNELCSLRPHEDKLTFAAVFEIDEKAKIKNEWFGRTVIHSNVRFTYEEAQVILEKGKGMLADELRLLNDIAGKLRKERFRKGAVNFETTEVKFKLDEKGIPLAVIPKVRKDAHKLIEEFMLLANKHVAIHVFNFRKGKEKNAFVYRTHDFPDPEKVKDFALFAKQFGHKMSVDESSISSSLNALMSNIEGKPEQNILEQLAIRTMAKAKYSTDAKGHFGLAFEHYTHFTSPIRRYPDMMVHRLLQHYLDEGKHINKHEYEAKCVHSSEREKRAADAERASIKYKQVEFMAAAEKRAYDGLISGVTEWGIFVEIIETKCEGMIRLADLMDDYYEFDERNYRITGRKSRKSYTLGDKVSVRVKRTDIDKRLIDLVFAQSDHQQKSNKWA
jgi:ribonuclease R